MFLIAEILSNDLGMVQPAPPSATPVDYSDGDSVSSEVDEPTGAASANYFATSPSYSPVSRPSTPTDVIWVSNDVGLIYDEMSLIMSAVELITDSVEVLAPPHLIAADIENHVNFELSGLQQEVDQSELEQRNIRPATPPVTHQIVIHPDDSENGLCAVCFTRTPRVMFGCKHLAMCYTCLLRCERVQSNKKNPEPVGCPICRHVGEYIVSKFA